MKDWPDQNPASAYVKGKGNVDPDWVHEVSKEEKETEQAKIEKRQQEFPAISETAASKFNFDASTGTITGVKDKSLTQISIPATINSASVKAIGKEAFANCYNLTALTMPDTITELGAGAFSNCRSLKYIHLSEGITEIKGAVYSSDDDSIYEMDSANGTFSGCSALESITIPKNVKRLGGYIFSGCDSLEEILFENYDFKEQCIATDPRGSDDDFASGEGNISWYAFKNVGRALYGLDFDDSYKGTKWHKALQEVQLTDDWRQNILNVYDSQLDYREGFSPYYVGGMNTKAYRVPAQASYWEWGHFSEAGKFHGIDGTTWCYAFTQWAYAMAGIPLDVSSKYYTWDKLKFAGGTYMPQAGDIIGVGKSHVAMIGQITENGEYVDIRIINGNHPNRNVGKELVRYQKSSGKALSMFDEETNAWEDLGEDSDDYKIRSVYCPDFSSVTTHTLTLDPGEGTVSYGTKVIAEGAVYGALPDAQRGGYLFDGWYTSASGGEKVLPYQTYKLTGNQTLYAHYKKATGAVTSITPVGENITVSVKGKRQLSVILTPAQSDRLVLSWRSSDTDIVTVDSDGEIKGIAEGSAVIEVRGPDAPFSVYIPVTVKGDKNDTSGQSSIAYVIDGAQWTFDKESGTILSVSSDWKGGQIPSVIDGVAVKAIGNTVGRSNQNIKFVILPEGITAVGDNAFSSCHSLESITLPASLTYVGQYAFSGCDQLTDISVAGTEETGNLGSIRCDSYAFGGTPAASPDFSRPYKNSTYYQNLMNVKLTGDFVTDAMAIAASQEGYHEGDSFEELGGENLSGDGEYCEMNYFKNSPDWLWHPDNYGYYRWGGWCGIFCQWAYALAGTPDEVMDVFAYKHQLSHTWDTTVYAKKGGTYELKKGDLIHFNYGHYAMVIAVRYDAVNDEIEIDTWNGNPDVALETYTFTASTGLYHHTMNDKEYYLAWYVPVTPEAAADVSDCLIAFDATGGTVSTASKKVYEGAYYGILPVPAKTGYTFGGWYTDKSGRGKQITPYSTVRLNGNVTLYAKWIGSGGKVWIDPSDTDSCTCDETGKHTLQKVEAKDPTCTADGNAAYYRCTVCGRYFASLSGKTELIPGDVTRKAGHLLEKTEGKKATQDEDGYQPYYTCTRCGKMFSDAAGTKEITEPVVIPKGTSGGGGGGNGGSGGVDSPTYYIVDADGYITKWDVYDVSVAEIPEKVGGVTVRGIKADSFAFGTRTALEKIIFPDTLTDIGKYAFWSCVNLKELSIPDTVTQIGEYAFGVSKDRADQSKLAKASIGNGVTTISKYAFFNCTSLTEVTIGSGIRNIEGYAFWNCSNLKKVTIKANRDQVTVGKNAFPDSAQIVYADDAPGSGSSDITSPAGGSAQGNTGSQTGSGSDPAATGSGNDPAGSGDTQTAAKAPAKAVIKSAKNVAKRSVKLKLKNAKADGYQIWYATDKKFKKGKKAKTTTKTTYTLKKLKKNKTYYIKVRAYNKKSGGGFVYGKWSKVKKVKIKK
ncbi:MAG: leucine-rich repeat protein [Lachnospiraceae bacterium]|nr:leucine-rich repeat protein [Lachnospiraceae bacterium]